MQQAVSFRRATEKEHLFHRKWERNLEREKKEQASRWFGFWTSVFSEGFLTTIRLFLLLAAHKCGTVGLKQEIPKVKVTKEAADNQT